MHRMLARLLQPAGIESIGFLDVQQIQDLLARSPDLLLFDKAVHLNELRRGEAKIHSTAVSKN